MRTRVAHPILLGLLSLCLLACFDEAQAGDRSGIQRRGGRAGHSGAFDDGGMAGQAGTAGDTGNTGAGGDGPWDGSVDAGNDTVTPGCLVDCSGSRPLCDESTQTCVQCSADNDSECTGDTPFCDLTSGTCIACLTDSDCTDPTASRCVTGSCEPCEISEHCTGISDGSIDLDVCDDGECVECTGQAFESCGFRPGGVVRNVCDSLARRCTDLPEHGKHACGTCVSDAECRTGQHCVLQTFAPNATEGADVGYFCLWHRDAGTDAVPTTDPDAPAGSCSSRPPYRRTQPGTTSIDGIVAPVCTLSVSTCVGVDHNASAHVQCAPGHAPDSTRCGHAGVDDAVCRQVPNDTAYRCTMRCSGSLDCINAVDCLSGACSLD